TTLSRRESCGVWRTVERLSSGWVGRQRGVTMFVQVIKGRTEDAVGLRRQLDRWRDEVRPGAIGFVGATIGIADDGTFIGVAYFTSEEAARKGESSSEFAQELQDYMALYGEMTFTDIREPLLD